MKKTILLNLILLLSFIGHTILAQTEIEAAKKYLENQVKQTEEILITKKQQDVLDADIIEASLSIRLGDEYNMNHISSACFIKQNGKLYAFENTSAMIEKSSGEFIKAFNPNFTLKTEEDAIKLRSIFFALDHNTKGKIFKQDDKWCFVQQDWFGELQYYEVTTNNAGKVTAIAFVEKKTDMPEETMGENKQNQIFNNENETVSQSDQQQIKKGLQKFFDSYTFDLVPIKFEGLENSLNLFDGKLSVKVVYEDNMSSSSFFQFVLLENNKKYDIIRDREGLLYNKEFVHLLSEKLTINNEAEAQQFEKLLDEIKTADKFEKKHYKKDNVWCFVREKTFDDLEGFLVLVDKNGKILYVDHSRNINDAAILKIKTYDPNFKLDYAFTLVEPTSKKISLKGNKKVPIKITYNADAVNAQNAYIAAFVDGNMNGFSAGTTMESPFTDEIESKYFDNGKHTLRYALLQSGTRDPNKNFAAIDIEITVEGGSDIEDKESVDKLVNNILNAAKNKDEKAFESCCLTKEKLDRIIEGININSDEDKEIKENLEDFDTEESVEKAKQRFKALQDIILDNKADISKITFKAYEEKRTDEAYPYLKVLKVMFVYQVGDLLGAVKSTVMVDKNGAYLIGMKPMKKMITLEMYNNKS